MQGGKCLVSGPIFDLLDKCFLQIFAQTKENGTLRILKAQELHIAFDWVKKWHLTYIYSKMYV